MVIDERRMVLEIGYEILARHLDIWGCFWLF
jgi:hypothetical protein